MFSLEEQCTGVHLQRLQHPCSKERPIHSRSRILLEVWSNVFHHQSWSTPGPSIYLKKEVMTIGQVASDMTSLLLTCYFRAVYCSGILCSGHRASSQSCSHHCMQVLIYTWVQPLSGLHALFWDLSVSNASVSTSRVVDRHAVLILSISNKTRHSITFS